MSNQERDDDMQITEQTALELGRMIKNKEISVREAVDASYQRIAALDGELNSYVTLDQEAAYARAEQVQAGIEDGSITGPLAGVPAAVKDNICTEGLLTTCSSKILYNFVPTYSAEAVLNMEKAGAVILGKTNMDEFAMGSTTETSAYGPTKNPRNTARRPAVLPAAPARRWQLGKRLMRLAPIPADRSGSRVRSAVWSG